MNLEERVKVLEDLMQRLTEAFLAEPTKPTQHTPIETEQMLLKNFPDNLAEELTGSDMGNIWFLTKPYKQGEEARKQFAQITQIVKSMGGRWVSDGRNSRWEIPK